MTFPQPDQSPDRSARDTLTPRRQKRQLRTSVRKAIHAIDPVARAVQESRLLAAAVKLHGLAAARTVLLYLPAFPEEIGLDPLIARVLALGQTLVLPRFVPTDRSLTLHAVADLERDIEFSPGSLREPHPELPSLDPSMIDWALVPGLAFDARGYRLGRGAGCYDRLLPQLRPGVPRYALALDPQVLDAVPVEPHDQPLTGILTSDRLILPLAS